MMTYPPHMDPLLDIRTLATASMITTVALSLLLVLIWSTRKTYPGFGRWTLGNVSLSLALFLTGLRGHTSGVISIGLSTALAYTTAILFYEGIRQFCGKPHLDWRNYGVAAAGLAGMVYFHWVVDNMDVRIVIASVGGAILNGRSTLELLRHPPASRKLGFSFTGGVFVLMTAAGLLRAVIYAVITLPPIGDFFAGTLVNAFFFILLVLFALAWTFGFLTLSNERLVDDLRAARDCAAASNRELRQAMQRAREMARRASEADEAKSRFLANVSHEIRTPLNGIIGVTELLRHTPLTTDQRQYLEIIHGNGEALLNLINDILDLSKIEAGRLELETVPFDLHALLEDVADTLALRVGEKPLEIAAVVAPEVPRLLEGDPARLRQILMNLGSNAVKFTGRGEVVLSVTRESERDACISLRFTVCDTGIGIPQDRQQDLFTRFLQLPAARHTGGCGLGLAISKRLAHLMGGSIGVESSEGAGSIFWFTAVLGRPAAPLAALERLADFSPYRLLLVDDSPAARERLSGLLASWGCPASQACGAQEALEKLRAAANAGSPYHAAILDADLGGVSGRDLAALIQREPLLRHTRMVLLVPLNRHPEILRDGTPGFAACLTKPVKQAPLRESLTQVLGLKSLREPSEMRAPAPLSHAGAGRKVLVVDDDRTNLRVARAILEMMGCRAATAPGGREALEMLTREAFDLVFLDCHMPEMDGYLTAQAVRAAAPVLDPQIPIIAMTAKAFPDDRERCLAAGMNDYVAKPVRARDLAAVLERWIVPDLRTRAAGREPSASS